MSAIPEQTLWDAPIIIADRRTLASTLRAIMCQHMPCTYVQAGTVAESILWRGVHPAMDADWRNFLAIISPCELYARAWDIAHGAYGTILGSDGAEHAYRIGYDGRVILPRVYVQHAHYRANEYAHCIGISATPDDGVRITYQGSGRVFSCDAKFLRVVSSEEISRFGGAF